MTCSSSLFVAVADKVLLFLVNVCFTWITLVRCFLYFLSFYLLDWIIDRKQCKWITNRNDKFIEIRSSNLIHTITAQWNSIDNHEIDDEKKCSKINQKYSQNHTEIEIAHSIVENTQNWRNKIWFFNSFEQEKIDRKRIKSNKKKTTNWKYFLLTFASIHRAYATTWVANTECLTWILIGTSSNESV